ncbi:MAG: AAA family ATPase [Anaerolineales bacterium]|nr:AAA family ATPase [Anaerolineales bacterium]
MSNKLDDQFIQLKQTIADIEAQRLLLGDAAVEASLEPLRQKLAELESQVDPSIEESPSFPTRQRKLVTLLYMDVVGSTAMTQHLDPEDTLEIMDNAILRLAAPIEAHGGHVTRYTGDGFKAVFGTPVAQENDPEMAIRAGLGILKISRELASELQSKWRLTDFHVRVGINTGLVALGGMTEAEDTVMGSAVILAKRVESAAPPDGLLISHNTYRHIRGIFNVELQEPIQAKGFDEPVPVYLVQSAKRRAFRARTRGVEGVETRMVGRESELLFLQKAYRNAIEECHTQIVTVVGDAGIGKSRLMFDFEYWLNSSSDEVHIYQGRGRHEAQHLPYALLRDLFTFRFQIQESDSIHDVHRKVEAGFGEVLGIENEGQMRAHIIGQLLGFDFSSSQHLIGTLDDPQQLRDRSLAYLGEYFQGMNMQAPTVIFLEDIHWADESSLDMVDRLTRRIPGQSLLIVCLARHRLFDRRPDWGEGLATHRRLELEPLSNTDSNKLVGEILQKVDQVPGALRELVVNGAEGNPFYIEELLKMLIEDGAIVTGEELWHVEQERLTEIEVPPTLSGVLQARLEGLPSGERITLQQASVVGRVFWDDTVLYINSESAPGGKQMEILSTGENLSELRSRELIFSREESAFAEAGEYIFKHAMLREVTYESVLKRLRKIYHGLVAEWLIQHSSKRAGENSGLIANHLELAEKTGMATIYLFEAGKNAAGRYAHSEALEYFSKALLLTPEDDLVRRFELLLARESVLEIQGDRESQHADLIMLKVIAKSLKDPIKQAQVVQRQMIYHYDISDYHTTVDMVDEALCFSHAAGDVEYEAYVYLRWGMALCQQAKCEEALPLLDHALSLAKKHQLHQVEADSLRVLGNGYSNLYDSASCKSHWERALDKYRQIGNKRGEANALNNLGVFYEDFENDFQRARDYYQQSMQMYHKIGDRLKEAFVANNLGHLAMKDYEFEWAIEELSKVLAFRCEIGDRSGERESSGSLFIAHYHRGNYEQAEDFIKRSLRIAQQLGIWGLMMENLTGAAWFYSAIGDFKKAELNYQQWLVDCDELENTHLKAWSMINIGYYRHTMGDNQGAMEYCRQVRRILGEDSKCLEEFYRLALLGHALSALDEIETASEVYDQAVNLGYEINLPRQAIEARAGSARVSMSCGENELALSQVEQILTYMTANSSPTSSCHPLEGTDDPFRIYLTCYQVLKANMDTHALSILTEAYNLLLERADKISDENLRYSFLNNVAANRDIVREFVSENIVEE